MQKSLKKYLRVPQFLKPKEKIFIDFLTFYFLLYLLWIVQVSRELVSSRWKPPSFLVKTLTLKTAILEKGLMLEIKLGPLFQGVVCPKFSELEVKDPQVMIFYQFYTIPQMNGSQIFVLQKNLRTYTLW